MKNIYQRLKYFRIDRNLTLKTLSESTGYSLRRLSTYELGDANIPITLLVKLYEVYKLNPAWLVLGKGEMFLKSWEDDREKSESSELRKVLEKIQEAITPHIDQSDSALRTEIIRLKDEITSLKTQLLAVAKALEKEK